MNKETLKGRWEILTWEQVYDDGRIVRPMGEDLDGFIEYTDRSMFIVIKPADRAKFEGGQWSASDAEKAAAYNTYLSYAGHYDVEGNTVIHNVEHAIFPNWEGGVQRRNAELVDGVLTLSARFEEGTADARTAKLTWKRA